MTIFSDLTQNLTLQKDDGPITAVRLVRGYDNSYALNADGQFTALSMGKNNLRTLVLGAEAEALEYLYLSGSQSLTEVVFEVPLPHLTHLYLNNCAITHITFPAGFRALQQIYLQKNGLQQLDFEGDYPSLVLMDVSENKLRELDFRRGFRELRYLYALNNSLEKIGLNRSMKLLNTLHLAENKLTELPPFLSEVEAMETLYLKGNQLVNIDREVWDTDRNCWDTMKGYLISLNKANAEMEYLHEAKMILIGNGEVGKTSIRLKLLDINAPLPDKNDRTPGLEVVPYTVPNLLPAQTGLSAPSAFTFNIWDFGGQGKYREIQQLFCSRKSLYLYVTAYDDKPNYKESYIGYEYWLSMANAYNHDNGQNSPVLYVQNKCDKEKEAINESEIKAKFSNIKDFIKISCADIQQFTLLPKVIAESIAKISDDIFSVQYNAEWLGVKQDLNNLRERGLNHISKQRFDEICRERGLNEDEIKAWLLVLDRIGTIIYFGENDKLSDWIVLNPIWVKDAVCKVIDFEFYDDIATLKPVFLPKIWKDYDNEERAKLQALLLAYDFCYEENGSFIVPALFSEEKPTYPTHLADFDCEIKFCYKPFLPAGTLHKFMVKLKSCIYNDLRWKKGVVLHDGATNTYAEVIERWEEHSIYIRLKGEKHLNLIWNTVRYSFEELNAILKATKFIKNLEFEVHYNYEGDWNTESQMAKICKLDDKNVFKKLLNSGIPRGLGEPDAPTKKMIDNSKPHKVTMAEGVRAFVPLSKIEKIKILFLAATPSSSRPINTGLESRFQEIIRLWAKEGRFEKVQAEQGLDKALFKGFLITENPHILHYGGHGHKEGIVLEKGDLKAETLKSYLKLSANVQCVILNACNSFEIAKSIAEYIPYVIATQAKINDDTAIAFSRGFYLGIAANKTIEEAFELGLIEIEDEELPGVEIPILVKGTPKT
jgi:Leucine-rich repeat (LRR) protein